MINVTLGNETKEEKAKGFPKLMKGKYGSIILADGENNNHYYGTLLHKGDSFDRVGEYSKIWAKSNFTDYNEPITIQNA